MKDLFFLNWLLFPFKFLYALILSFRAKYWLHRAWQPKHTCISIGNIAMGGTGKTPVVQWLANYLTTHSKKPAILTRGYQAHPPHLPYLIDKTSSVLEAGDEPRLLYNSCKIPVIVDPKRVRAALWAEQNLTIDYFILDDGFQHMAIGRNLDIVILTPTDLKNGWNKTIPLGKWREGKNALKRATCFLINTFGQNEKELELLAQQKLTSFKKPWFLFTPKITKAKYVQTDNLAHITDAYLLITGVATPEKVVNSCTDFFDFPPAKHLAFADHHHFTEKDCNNIIHVAHKLKIANLVCTTKDSVKLKELKLHNLVELILELDFYNSLLHGDIESFINMQLNLKPS